MGRAPASGALDTRTALLVGALATWRISHLLTQERGPADVVDLLRARVDRTPLRGLLDCFGCTSIWVGAACAAAVSGPDQRRRDVALGGLAMSGAAFLVHRGLETRHPGTTDWLPEPDVDSPLVTVLPASPDGA